MQQPFVPGAAERLAEVQVPTLIIVGDPDSEEVLSQAELLATGIAKSNALRFRLFSSQSSKTLLSSA